jgi:transcriptional regulator with PAS, ATPase and Fis domain
MSEGASATTPGWSNLETVFESLGRVLVVLDSNFAIIRASRSLDRLADAGAAAAAIGKPIEDLIGARLFGPTGTLREALRQGKREEGRRGVLLCSNESARLVSITAAPVTEGAFNHCDPRARYLIVIRPAEEDDLLLQSAIVTHGLVTRSASMRRIVHLVESLNHSDATVLITGESGTGKEVIARALHAHSPHSGGPFVAVNCAALPAPLLESELFGHVKGSFTGAVKDRNGRCEVARGGTLFLDEVGDIPLEIQVKLLRVLQEKVFERVGESTPRKLEARIIAATNVDLKEAIRSGRFREDLYYRLRVVPIHIPPLRERPEDIGLIARHLLARIGGREGRALRLSPDTSTVLETYPWPGNVRELENTLEYAVALCRGQNIQLEDLPLEIREWTRTPASPAVRAEFVSDEAGEESDAARIRSALDRNRWNHSRAAHELGMSRTTLWRRIKELRIGEG